VAALPGPITYPVDRQPQLLHPKAVISAVKPVIAGAHEAGAERVLQGQARLRHDYAEELRLEDTVDVKVDVPRPGGPRQCSTRQRSVA
jgi:hypothetical protein